MDRPDLYLRGNDLQRRDAVKFIDEFRAEIGKMSGRCLDIGSGPGDVTVDLILPKFDPTATVVCADISENMLNFGREKYKDNSRVSFVQLDIATRDLPKNLIGQFDNVTSFYCINWCHDLRQVFDNIFDLLRPGGTTFLVFLANSPLLDAYANLAATDRYGPYMKDAYRFVPIFQHTENRRDALKKIIEDAGFEIYHCSVRESTYTFDTSDIFSKFLLGVEPFGKRMPIELWERYERDLVEEAAIQCVVPPKKFNNADEYRLLYQYKLFIVRLRKPLTKSL